MGSFDFLTDPIKLAALVTFLLPLILENWPWLQGLGEEVKRIFALLLSAVVAVAAYLLAVVLAQQPFDLNALAILILAVAGAVLGQVAFGFYRAVRIINPSE